MSSPLRILYVAAVRLPTDKAHGAQIMQTCEALADKGVAVELAVPGRKSLAGEDPFAYYRLARNFQIVTLAVPDWFAQGRFGFFIASFLFGMKAALYARHFAPSHIYSRDKAALFAISLCAPKAALVWEMHGEEPGFISRYLLRRARVVAISEGIKAMLLERGVALEHICVAPDGVATESFAQAESQEAARARLALPKDKRVAMYVGRLDGWKGVGTLLEAASLLPQDVLVIVIGGETDQVERFKKQYPRVLFLGFMPYANIANNQAAADVLVLPNTATDITSVRYTSPLKLFTYMASGRPIVASDLPSIREVLTEQSCYFVEPDSPAALAKGIETALSSPDAPRKAALARTLVEQYTWESRAQKIVSYLQA